VELVLIVAAMGAFIWWLVFRKAASSRTAILRPGGGPDDRQRIQGEVMSSGSFKQWAKNHQDGNEALATSEFLLTLSEYTLDFDRLPEYEQAEIHRMFTGWIAIRHPDRDDLVVLASEFTSESGPRSKWNCNQDGMLR
jgi:hypothetical protein